jgi:hypothetical protein
VERVLLAPVPSRSPQINASAHDQAPDVVGKPSQGHRATLVFGLLLGRQTIEDILAQKDLDAEMPARHPRRIGLIQQADDHAAASCDRLATLSERDIQVVE